MIADNKQVEIIVKFNGDIFAVSKELGALAEIIDCSYAILTIDELKVNELYNFRQIEYFEPAKPIMPVSILRNEMSNAGITPVKDSGYRLSGKGVITGIIDSGIDFTHANFLNSDGSSRILYIWDQSLAENAPEGFIYGTEYNSEAINNAMKSPQPFVILPSRDFMGHGTAVAGIAAGNNGIASSSSIISVKLGSNSEARTTDILRAVRYIINKAVELNMPVSINISYGMNDGSHTGNSLFEKCLDILCQKWKTSVSVAMGNEGSAGHHFSSVLESGKTIDAELVCQAVEGSIFIDIWKSFNDDIELELISPNGISSGTLYSKDIVKTINFGEMTVIMNFRPINHYNLKQEIMFLFESGSEVFISGIWRLNIRCISAVDGRIDIWLPTTAEVGVNTAFLNPDEIFTLTLPSTVENVISVGGYNSVIGSLAYFTGKGIRFLDKPDIVAPAVDIYTSKSGGGYDSFSGTSMAAPFVAGCAALMMEWGIVKGRKPFLYGQMLKAYLQKGARRNKNIRYPDDGWGYGSLDLKRTIDLLELSI